MRHVGGVQGRGVVDAVAHEAHDVAGLAQGEDDALLLVGLHFGKDLGSGDLMAQRLVAHLAHFRPGEQAGRGQAHLAGDVGRHQGVVAGDDLQGNPEFLHLPDDFGDPRLGRIIDQQKAHKGHTGFVVLADVSLRSNLPIGDPQGAQALLAELGKVLLNLRPAPASRGWLCPAGVLDLGTDRQHVAERPLGDHQVGLALFGHQDGKALADEIVRHFVQLAVAGDIGAAITAHRLVDGIGETALERRIQVGVIGHLIRLSRRPGPGWNGPRPPLR